MKTKKYLVILDVRESPDSKVVLVLQSDPVDKHNMWTVATALSDQWRTMAKRYPHPDYDIVVGYWGGLDAARNAMHHSYGWDAAPVCPLAPQSSLPAP